MRVETPKSNEISKKDNSNINSEKSIFDSTRLPNSQNIATNSPTTSSFAKILDEARHENKEKDVSSKSDTESKEINKSDDDSKTENNKSTDEKKEVDEKEQNSHDSQEESDSQEEGNSFVPLPVINNQSNLSEITPPPARAILHVADLERIVSFVRSENTNTEKQILISLKNSVLEGLQIKLSFSENGNLKAEFIAQSEEIKKQLKKREKELFDILKQRSSKFNTLDILLS